MTATAPRSSLALADLVRDRLQANRGGLGVSRVYGILNLVGARKQFHTPAVAAFILADDFEPPLDADDDEAVVQRHVATLAVVCVVTAFNDPGGRKGETEDRLSPLVAGTRALLLGWPPDGESIGRELVRTDATMRALIGPTDDDLLADMARWRPFVLRRGRLNADDEGSGRVWWQDEYVTHRMVRGVHPETISGSVPTALCVDTQGDGAVMIDVPEDAG